MQGPFHLTWPCKRFSQRPKEGECRGTDKVPRQPDGSCRMEGGMEIQVKGESSPKECLLNTRGKFCGLMGGTRDWPGEAESVCVFTCTFPAFIALICRLFPVTVNVSSIDQKIFAQSVCVFTTSDILCSYFLSVSFVLF